MQLYVLFFLSTSVNTAWLSFLTAMSLAGLPVLLHTPQAAVPLAVALAVAATSAGERKQCGCTQPAARAP